MKTRFDSFVTIPAMIVAGLLFASPDPAHADGWELLTTEVSVPGTREIESGDPAAAIRRSKAFVGRAIGEQQFAALNNLCVAHILLGQHEMARDYCDRATGFVKEAAVVFNNRGVMNAVSGNPTDAAADFAAAIAAGCIGECSEPESAPGHLPRAVARRNQERNELLVAVAVREIEAARQASDEQ